MSANRYHPNPAKQGFGLESFFERIVGPALRHTEGVEWLSAPNRHHDVIKHMRAKGMPGEAVWNSDQGFWTSTERYVSREEAWDIAKSAGQITNADLARRPRELFTECMW